MSDREVMQLALEALDSNNPDIQLRAAIALRTALAAPPPEPVAWMCEGYSAAYGDYLNFRSEGERRNSEFQNPKEWKPLYAAPPAAAPQSEQTHPGYVIGSHWLETAYSRICAGEAEADVLRDYKAAIDAAIKGDKT